MSELNMRNFVVCYGMTETSPVTFQGFISDPLEVRTSTAGFPSNHQEVAVMDSAGRIVEAGVEGELVTRGYSTMLGYWADPERTAEVRDTTIRILLYNIIYSILINVMYARFWVRTGGSTPATQPSSTRAATGGSWGG